ncbi:acyl-CoA dehydrogenase family protein [Streptomyces varsoviensis]|uniref:acyl-CoA dehydrogenase family protein n=1 Tax=Streptomyces varsoviensis TaxID=67373 RepID=UPI0033F0113A
MDFTPTPEQRAARELAASIFGDLSTHERLKAAGTGCDPELWKTLCASGLPGAVEEVGLLGLVLLLEEQGRTTAQVPYASTCAYGLLPVAAHGTDEQRARLLPGLRDGTLVAAGAFPPRAATAIRDASCDAQGGWRLTGTFPAVPWLREATHVLVPARLPDGVETGCFLAEAGAARSGGPVGPVAPVELTAPWSAGRLTLAGAPAERLGDADTCASVLAVARTAFAGLQAGVCAGSLARAVEYTTSREQFGRPLAANQGVMLRAADAYMDTEAIRVTAYEAAWRHDERLPARTHALTAAWWASEAGKRVVHAGQHLHGGMGADLDHPVHRHFLWGRQLDAYLGSGPELLEELGELLTDGDREAA